MSKNGRGGEDVGISNRRGARCKSPVSRTRGVREVSATCNSQSEWFFFRVVFCFLMARRKGVSGEQGSPAIAQ